MIGHSQWNCLSNEFAKNKCGIGWEKVSVGVFDASGSATAVYASCRLERENGDGSIKTERKRTSLALLILVKTRWKCNVQPISPSSCRTTFPHSDHKYRGSFFVDRAEQWHYRGWSYILKYGKSLLFCYQKKKKIREERFIIFVAWYLRV